jgi:acetyltransferase-like isoleucine patch superfamily enzyme
MEQPLGSAPVVIGSNVLVLSGAVVVHGTTIGNNAIVCANALVGPGSYGPGVVLLGNPARAVRKLSPEQREAAG